MIEDIYLNPATALYPVYSPRFLEYGKVYNCNTKEAVDYLINNVALPEEGNFYKANDEKLIKLSLIKNIEREVFGEIKVQAGWCCGYQKKMNAMEWHKSSEVIIAATDMVLLLGHFCDVVKERYDSKKAEGFYLKKGDIIELYPMVLHFSPLCIGEYFIAAIILPKETNLILEEGISGMLRAKNKWLLVHPENEKAISCGGIVGIDGDNITISKYEKK